MIGRIPLGMVTLGDGPGSAAREGSIGPPRSRCRNPASFVCEQWETIRMRPDVDIEHQKFLKIPELKLKDTVPLYYRKQFEDNRLSNLSNGIHTRRRALDTITHSLLAQR